MSATVVVVFRLPLLLLFYLQPSLSLRVPLLVLPFLLVLSPAPVALLVVHCALAVVVLALAVVVVAETGKRQHDKHTYLSVVLPYPRGLCAQALS